MEQFDDFVTFLYVLALSCGAGFARFMVGSEVHSLAGLARGLFLAMFVGFNAYVFASDIFGDKQGYVMVLTSVGAFLADFILVALIKVGDQFSQKPVAWIRQNIFKK